MAQHHPGDAWLLDFTTGNLPVAFETIISAHVGACEACRTSIALAERVGGELLAACGEQAVVVEPDAIPGRFEESDARAIPGSRAVDAGGENGFDYFVSNYLNTGSGALPWKRIGQGLQLCKLAIDGDVRMWMLKAQPGTVLPTHTHAGSELTLVLKGAYFCGSEIYGAGDIEDADESTEHQPMVTRDGECICLAVTEGSLRFRDWLPRLVQPFVGI